MNKKRSISLILALLLVFTMIPNTGYAKDTIFSDISNSPYKESIIELHNKGIIKGDGKSEFRPKDDLTKAELSTLLVKGFKLPEINSLYVEEDIEKQFTYKDTLGVIDDSFVVYSADDIRNHWAETYIEGLIKVRAIDVDGSSFNPEDSVTKKDFYISLAKVLYGVDKEVNYTDELSKLEIYNKKDILSVDNITREETANALNAILSYDKFETLTILATADIHGHIEPYMPSGANRNIGGMSRMKKFVDDTRSKQDNTLLVDIGDAPYNTNVANLFEGKPVIEIMNMMNYDAMVLGNHDFDFPQDIMEKNSKLANFPFLSANTYYNGKYPNYLEPSVVKDVNGIKIGIIGLTDHNSGFYTHPNNVKGIEFKDQFETAKKEVDKIKDDTDIIISLAHLHTANEVLGKEIEGIDFVFGGGTDIVDYPRQTGNSWLISSGKHAELVSQTNLNLLDGEVIGFNFAHIFMTENLEEDEDIVNLVDKYTEELNKEMEEVIGETKVSLEGERGVVRREESNLGNLISDSLIELTDADIALQNGGGIRASINKGNITLKDIYTVLPFDNTVVVLEASGQTIWDTIEHSISSYPSAAGGFLQVAGIEYTFDAAKEVGNRLVSIKHDGKDLDLDKTYKVVTNDFLSGGGDKFDMLKDEGKIMFTTKYFLRDAFREYIINHKTVEPVNEGRIKILNPIDDIE